MTKSCKLLCPLAATEVKYDSTVILDYWTNYHLVATRTVAMLESILIYINYAKLTVNTVAIVVV